MDLSTYSLVALQQALQHLNKVESQAMKDQADFQGPGWQPLLAILARDRAALEAEIARR